MKKYARCLQCKQNNYYLCNQQTQKMIWLNKNMGNILTLEQIRLICVSVLSSVLAFYTPSHGFLVALLIMFGFNIWCGMRADGVSIVRCENFSMKKFSKSLKILFLYVLIILTVFTVMKECGDEKESVIAVKSLTYVFMYVYLQNGFKNLIVAYPDVIALHIVYHVIRLEFQRALPARIQKIIDRYERGKLPDINDDPKDY